MVDAMKYTDHATASNKETYDKKARRNWRRRKRNNQFQKNL